MPTPTTCRSCWAPAPAASGRPRISLWGLLLNPWRSGDFNGDGKLDLAVANADSNNVSILLGTGTGSFGAATNFGVGTGPRSVAVGDFTGDGTLDLAVANLGSNNVSILLNGCGDSDSDPNRDAANANVCR